MQRSAASIVAVLAGAALLAPLGAQSTLYATNFDAGQDWTLTPGCWGAFVGWQVRPFFSTYGVPAPSPARALGFIHPSGAWPNGHWCGEASSPAIDLSGAVRPELGFEYFWDHEGGCEWDAFGFEVRSEATGAVLHDECLSFTLNHGYMAWAERRLALEPAWGVVRIVFTQDTIDGWNGWESGCWVDDVIVEDLGCDVTIECVGTAQASGAPGPTLGLAGPLSVAANSVRLQGAGFPLHTFAAAFVGGAPATLPFSNGVRCISPVGSSRLSVAPTRDQGRPDWALDLAGAPLSAFALVGSPFYLQTIYRDGQGVNFSDALRVFVCP